MTLKIRQKSWWDRFLDTLYTFGFLLFIDTFGFHLFLKLFVLLFLISIETFGLGEWYFQGSLLFLLSANTSRYWLGHRNAFYMFRFISKKLPCSGIVYFGLTTMWHFISATASKLNCSCNAMSDKTSLNWQTLKVHSNGHFTHLSTSPTLPSPLQKPCCWALGQWKLPHAWLWCIQRCF